MVLTHLGGCNGELSLEALLDVVPNEKMRRSELKSGSFLRELLPLGVDKEGMGRVEA